MVTSGITRFAHKYNSGTDLVKVSNHLLLEVKPIAQEKANAVYCNSGEKSVVGKLTGPRGALSTFILLNG